MTFNVTSNSTNLPAVRSFNTTGNSTDVRPVSSIPGGGTGPAQLKRHERRKLERKNANAKIQEMKKSSTPTRHQLSRAEIVDRIKKEQREKRIAPSGRVDTTIRDGEHGVLLVQQMPTKTDTRDYLKFDDLLVLTSGHFKVFSGDMNRGQSTQGKIVVIGANRYSEEVNTVIRAAARNNDVLLTDVAHDYVYACYAGSLHQRCLFGTVDSIDETVRAIAPEQAQQERTLYVLTDSERAFTLGAYLRDHHRGLSFRFELL